MCQCGCIIQEGYTGPALITKNLSKTSPSETQAGARGAGLLLNPKRALIRLA